MGQSIVSFLGVGQALVFDLLFDDIELTNVVQRLFGGRPKETPLEVQANRMLAHSVTKSTSVYESSAKGVRA